MMTNQTLDKLHSLNLKAMADAISEQLANPEFASLSFEERLGLAVDRECDARASRSLARKLRDAFRQRVAAALASRPRPHLQTNPPLSFLIRLAFLPAIVQTEVRQVIRLDVPCMRHSS